MQIKILEQDKRSIEFELTDITDTLIYPLMDQLLDDSKVDIASHTLVHPELDKTKIYVRVKEGKPETVIKKALKDLEKEFQGLHKKVEKL